MPVRILLQVRKFFCDEERCSRCIFTEHLPGTVARYSRRSYRSGEALNSITLALGGRAGARLARKLGLLASGPTLLRVIRKSVRPSGAPTPRILGIDEWAWKKGHRYGTMLCDLERGRVIDLLPNRSTETVAAWLSQHPSVQVVRRNRASSFADAIAKGAPKAVQVADRGHLLNNLLDTLIRSLERHRHTMSEVAQNMARQSAPLCQAERHDAALTEASRRTLQKREHRLSIYKELMRLLDAGTTQSAASQQLDVSLRTVQRWLTYGVFPERQHRVFQSIVDTYGPHLEKRYGEGCRNIALLCQEIKAQGFEGQSSTVSTWLRHRFGSPKEG